MNQLNKKNRIIEYTISWATKYLNWIDWIRTIYFALLSASLINLCFRISTLSNISTLFFIAGIIFFIIGSWSSVEILSRFKKHQKEHDSQTREEKLKTTSESFFLEKETAGKTYSQLLVIRFQHVSFYTMGIFALFLIGLSVRMDPKNNKSYLEIEQSLREIKIHTHHSDSLFQTFSGDAKEKRLLRDSLITCKKNLVLGTKQIDSLKKEIKLLQAKARMESQKTEKCIDPENTSSIKSH